MLKASDTGQESIHPTPKTSGTAQTLRICRRPAAPIGRIWSVGLQVQLQYSRRNRARPLRGTLERPNQSRSLSGAPLHGAEGTGTVALKVNSARPILPEAVTEPPPGNRAGETPPPGM